MLEQAIFKQPDEAEYRQIKQMVKDFRLDDENMKPEQFSILSDNGKVIAFGRLKEKEDATELGTLGVAEEFRRKGLGEKMVKHLLKQVQRDVYVVTTIYVFFARLGFVLVDEYPESIGRKVEKCVIEYPVDEPYFVMKREISRI